MENKNELNDLMSSNFLSIVVSVNKWSATRTDRDASDELTQNKGAVVGAAKVVKSLMAGASAELKEVASAYDAVRTYGYSATLPYVTSGGVSNKGPRLLPTINSLPFLKHFSDLKAQAESSLESFLQVYDQRKQQALINQGAMADASQYPDVDEVRRLFSVSMSVTPVPARTDFSRGLIPPKVADALGNRLVKQQESAMNTAMEDLRKRLLAPISTMVTQLGKVEREEKTRIYDSLVDNVRSIVGLLEASNITSNPDITAVVERIKQELCPHDADAYKDNPTLAGYTAKSAVDIGNLIDDIEFF